MKSKASASQAPMQVSPLASHIYRWIHAQQSFYGRSSEDSVYEYFTQQGYERSAIWLAMRELYQAGKVNRVTYH